MEATTTYRRRTVRAEELPELYPDYVSFGTFRGSFFEELSEATDSVYDETGDPFVLITVSNRTGFYDFCLAPEDEVDILEQVTDS